MSKIAVVILNWNGTHHLEKFLPSVVAHSSEAKLFVIDNCSTDNSVEFLQKNFPTVKIIHNSKNYGFAGGYNEGLKSVDADLFVLLNSDVEVTADWLKLAINKFESDLSIAALQPTICSFNKKEYFEHAGAAGGFMDKDFYPFCRGRILNELEKNNNQYVANIELFWASGACLFIRKSAFFEVGGFDDHFFAHMEEIDLCFRLKNRGYKIVSCTESLVYHLGGGTLAYENPKKTYLNFRNNLFLIHKNYYESILFFKIVRRLCLDGLAGIVFLFTGKFKHFAAIIKAHFHYYGAINRLSSQRKALKKRVNNPNKTGRYSKSIIFDFYLRKKKKFSDLNLK